MDIATEKRIVGEKGGPSGPFYSVVTSTGRVVAMQIIEREDAELIARIPELVKALESIAEYHHEPRDGTTCVCDICVMTGLAKDALMERCDLCDEPIGRCVDWCPNAETVRDPIHRDWDTPEEDEAWTDL